VLEYRYRKNFYILIIVAISILLSQNWAKSQRDKQQMFQHANRSKLASHHHKVTPLGKRAGVVTVTTDTIKVWIHEKGVMFERLDLENYTKKLHGKNKVSLLGFNEQGRVSIMQSGFTGDEGTIFKTKRKNYKLAPGKNSLQVDFIGYNAERKTTIKKSFVFQRGSYTIKTTNTIINNNKGKQVTGRSYMVIGEWGGQDSELWKERLGYQGEKEVKDKKGGFTMQAFRSYSGFSYHTHKKPYVKLSEKDIKSDSKNGFETVVSGGWIASQQPYFIRAWVPQDARKRFQISAKNKNKENYTMSMKGDVFQLSPGQTLKQSSALYVGPEVSKKLKQLAPGLELTVDYGMLWIISDFIYWMMSVCFQLTHNWGWSIILVTVFIRSVMYHFSTKSFRATITMRTIKPKMDELKKRYSDDPMKQKKAIADLYAKEKVDPVGGCLPNLLTLPIFFALYFVLIESVSLRHAPFIFWIQDLSAKDPRFVLPVLYGLSMWFQQRVNPPTQGAFNQEIMNVLPLMMTFLFSTFPAGLILYMLANNVFMATHNWIVNKDMGVYDDGYRIIPDIPWLQKSS
jgi:YidC/Oxa1 family membrane protein insertase